MNYTLFGHLYIPSGFICQDFSWKNDYFILEIGRNMKKTLFKVKYGL